MEPAWPAISIHKGWRQSQNRQNSKHLSFRDHHKAIVGTKESGARAMRKAATQRQYEFVNATVPDQTKDADVRKLVRTHVRNDYLCDKRRKIAKSSLPLETSEDMSVQSHSPSDKKSSPEAEPSKQHDIKAPTFLGFPTALCMAEYAFEMQPRMHALLSRYLTLWARRCILGSYVCSLIRSSHWYGLGLP
jgi:hypothetical protein